jgi:hypothetical protein
MGPIGTTDRRSPPLASLVSDKHGNFLVAFR